MPQSEAGGAPREHRHPSQPAPPVPLPHPPQINVVHAPVTESARGRTLSYEELSRCFHLPINAAAKELGVCVTALKKQCRKHGVQRWPHRKLKSLDKLKEKLEKEEATAADKEYYKHEIHSITQKKDHIFRSSSASATNPSNGSGSAPLGHIVSAPPPGTLHPRPGHQFVLGHPMAAYPAPSVPSKLASTNGTSRNSGSAEADRQQQQQQQHIFAGPVLMPVAQMPGGSAASIAGPNGTLIHQPLQGAPQQYSLCGIYGCDCYVNNGVSSRMYHPPLPVPRHNSAASQNGTSQTHASTAPNVHYYNPHAYAYPAMASMAPYQNMVQVNVVEQPTFSHGANRPAQPSSAGAPSSPQVNKASGNSSSAQTKGGTKHPGKPHGFEMYGGVPQPVPSHGGFMYNFVPHNVHYEGMVPHQSNGAPIHGPVPGYWPDMQHQSQPTSNMVTMCNQTVHHHHHHGSAPASPCLAQKDPTARQDVDNASSKTNESERMDVVTEEKKMANAKVEGATGSVDMQSKNNEITKPTTQAQLNARDNQNSVNKITEKEREQEQEMPSGRRAEKGSVPIHTTPTQRTVSSRTQSESKGPNSEVGANGFVPKGVRNGTVSRAMSDSTCYSSRSDEDKQGHAGSTKRPNKRARTQLTPEQGEMTNTAGASSSTPNGKMQSPVQNAVASRKEPPVAVPNATANAMNRARRFDHVVHQCRALASVQWCTDVSFKVTLALGPKGMLGLAGVPSLGKNILEGTETAIEERSDTKKRYVLAAEGNRLEWIATNGNARYLIVLNPFRNRNSREIIGVSGLMVELKIIRALQT